VFGASEVTQSLYPEVAKAQSMEKYRETLKNMSEPPNVKRIEIKSRKSAINKSNIVDPKIFDYHSVERQSNKKPVQSTTTDQIKLSPTKTKRATNDLSNQQTLDAH
jgi:hypothetical protein